MSISFNADEILEIAQRIEQNSLNFYPNYALIEPRVGI